MAKTLSTKAAAEQRDRKRRMKWWHEARFGMFIHWGLYALVGRHEWSSNQERIPWDEYYALADQWKPKANFAREWAKMATTAGQKYMVLTTRHHDGFSLFDSAHSDANSVKMGPKRDLVGEYVEACRSEGHKVGLYYSLIDWHHPDGMTCLTDMKARRRYLDYVRGQLNELMSNYGQIDILWYDVPYPMPDAKSWEMTKINGMIRKLQPGIIINDRGHLQEDYATPEENLHAAPTGRAWEAAMTFNGSWGYMDSPDEDYRDARHVLFMLQQVAFSGGNLLLNIGPEPDGSVPPPAVKRLTQVGNWLRDFGGEALYGNVDRAQGLDALCNYVEWTRKGNDAYVWFRHWPGERADLGYFKGTVKKATLLNRKGDKPVKVIQENGTLSLAGLPKTCPDKVMQMAVVKLECASRPRRQMVGHYAEKPVW